MTRRAAPKKVQLAEFNEEMLGAFHPISATGPRHHVAGNKAFIYSRWTREEGVTLKFEIDHHTVFNLDELNAFRDLLIRLCDELATASKPVVEGEAA